MRKLFTLGLVGLLTGILAFTAIAQEQLVYGELRFDLVRKAFWLDQSSTEHDEKAWPILINSGVPNTQLICFDQPKSTGFKEYCTNLGTLRRRARDGK